MVVAKADTGHLLVGLTPNDIEQMRKGLTKTKQGGLEWGFPSMIVFMGETEEKILALLKQPDQKRQDDLFPNTGSG